jgi:hypothetical protein
VACAQNVNGHKAWRSPPVANAAAGITIPQACVGLRLGFPAVDRLHRCRGLARPCLSLSAIPSLFGDPLAFAFNIMTLSHRIPNVIPPYTSAKERVSASLAPPLCHQPEVPYSRRATGQQSGFYSPLDCQ